MLRKATVLPITFLRGCSGRVRGNGGDRGVDRVGGGVTSVLGDVSCCGGMTSGACSCSGRCVIDVAGGSVGGHCGGARFTARYLTTRPSAPCVDSCSRSAVIRVVLFEIREHVIGAVGGPERQRLVILLV